MTTRLLILAAAALGAGAQTSSTPLRLEEVLRSTGASHPLLLETIQERAMAQGKVLGARGAFDTKLSVKSEMNQFGFFKNRTNQGGVEQPLRTWGAEVYGGYKRGQGNFGPWEEDLLTLSRGEWSGGLRVPLFRDRAVDERRTAELLAELSVELAGASIEQQRLKLLEAAARSYWSWVAAARKLPVAETLLQLAEERRRQVEEAVDAGQIAAIEIVDNQRAVFDRKSAVVAAGREFQNAAFELSLFYRDSQGRPRTAGRDRAPEFPEPPSIPAAQGEADLARALAERPEVAAALTKLQQSEASLRLARNQLAPEVDLVVEYSRDAGTGSITKRGGEFIAGLSLSNPFQRRKAKGKVALEQARLEQVRQRLRFARDRVRMEVQDALSALEAAIERLGLARAELEAAERMAEAERERFELGDSSLFVVNLRELAAADARLKVVRALADSHQAHAAYRTATAGW